MPLDAVCLRAVVHELDQKLKGGRIEKIYQPERDEIVLAIRGIEGARRLLISTASGAARMHFIDIARENPSAPPMFCMLLRKHIQGSKIASITQPDMERVAVIELDANDEMGVPTKKYLICEFLGGFANLVVKDAEGRIIDAQRRIEGDLTGKRQILPGLFYHMPPQQEGKQDLLSVSESEIMDVLSATQENRPLDKWILSHFAGLSPLLCRELAYRATGDTEKLIRAMTGAEQKTLVQEFMSLIKAIKEYDFQPCMLTNQQTKRVFDFAALPIRQYGDILHTEILPSFSSLLAAFYEEKGKAERMRRRSHDMNKTVVTARDRLARKLAAQEQELLQTKNRDRYKRMGDLITANIYQLQKGERMVRVVDYYAEDCPEVEVQLDVQLTPQQNAQRYYKKYNKAKTAEEVLQKQIHSGRLELEYLESVLESIRHAEDEQAIVEIREELLQTGYLSKKQQRGRKAKKNNSTGSMPYHYRTSDGFDVFAGKNNLQNDQLTLKTAYKSDLWFHTQKIHGSHVILVIDGREPTDIAMTEAACIAAYHSKGRHSAMVPVDYTEVRNIKKPSGAKPGMVIYHVYRTAYVTPKQEDIDALRIK